uniref:Uncharacterized protein n=1 Tax=Rhodnius prolixus TaxID=13249 RepID=T1HH98_RHOPR
MRVLLMRKSGNLTLFTDVLQQHLFECFAALTILTVLSLSLQPWKILTSSRGLKPWKKLTSSRGLKPWKIITSSRGLKPWKILTSSRGLKPWKILTSSRGLPPWKILTSSRGLKPSVKSGERGGDIIPSSIYRDISIDNISA